MVLSAACLVQSEQDGRVVPVEGTVEMAGGAEWNHQHKAAQQIEGRIGSPPGLLSGGVLVTDPRSLNWKN